MKLPSPIATSHLANPTAASSIAVAANARRLHLPRGFRREGARLLEQQCWLWGRDVRLESGNLLLAHGFDRARPPQGIVGASAYRLRLLPDENYARERVIALWGFGIWYGETDETGDIGGIFIGRAMFEPRWNTNALPPSDAWNPAPIVAATVAPQGREQRRQARELLANAMLWISGYECWALARVGRAERGQQLQGWQQRHSEPIAPDELPTRWRALASGL